MIVFCSQILYDPFSEDLFHNGHYINERTLWEKILLQTQNKKERKSAMLVSAHVMVHMVIVWYFVSISEHKLSKIL